MRLLAKLLAAKQAQIQAVFQAKQTFLNTAAERKIDALEARAERLEDRANDMREHFNAKADAVREHYNAKAAELSEKGLDHLAARFEAMGEAKAGSLESFGERAALRLENTADRLQSKADALKSKLDRGDLDDDDVNDEDEFDDEAELTEVPEDTTEAIVVFDVDDEGDVFIRFPVDQSEGPADMDSLLAEAEQLLLANHELGGEATKILFENSDGQVIGYLYRTEDGWSETPPETAEDLMDEMSEDELAALAGDDEDEDEDETVEG